MTAHPTISRREAIKASSIAGLITVAGASPFSSAHSAEAFPAELRTAIDQYTSGRPWTEARVKFEIAELVDNGNTVPISIKVESLMNGIDQVTDIAVFNERNPQRDTIRFSLSADTPIAQVDARIRLATTQRLVAIARMKDGSYYGKAVDVIVTIAACIESD